MIDTSLKAELIELLADTFTPDQIDEIGCLLMKNYCSHEVLGIDDHITVPKRKAASALVEYCEGKKCMEKLLQFIIEIDEGTVLGKKVLIENLENFLNKLSRTGLIYDEKKRKLRKAGENVLDMPDWGFLREGRRYEMTVASLDIVGNSEMVNRFGMRKMEKLYYRFWNFLRRHLEVYDGRIWHWAGDGGLLAFTAKKHFLRAVQFAVEIQSVLPLFNADPEKPIEEDISIRIGMDTGKIKFSTDTGRIVSEVINFAAHVEKNHTKPGEISVSAELFEKLPPRIAEFFYAGGEFEGRTVYASSLVSRLN
jgi:class 3 adenylate cyclase